MALRGELLSADLAAVFQMVALNQQRGRLRVREKGSLTNRRQLYIEENRIRLDDRPAAHPIAAMLVEMGHINLVKYRGLKSRLARYQGDQRVALRDQGVVDLAALTRVQARVEEELIMEMFLWKNITFELIEGVKPEREDAPVFIIDHLIMEAARRSDEWGQHIAPHGFQHQICVSTGQEEGLGEVSSLGQIVHEHLDGLQSGATLVEQIGLSRYHVEMALRDLRQRGFARPLSADELIAAGDSCFRINSMEDARRLYRTALSERRLDLALHEKLAIVERSTGSVAKSCAHLRFCAHLAYEQGDMESAYARNQEVLDVLITDLRPLFFNLHILAECKAIRTEARVQRCIQEGSRLATILAEAGRMGEALEILDAVFVIEPNREDILVRRSRLLVTAGRTEEAVDLLQLRVAEREAGGDLAGAASLLRLLQELHPSARHQYQARLGGLTKKRHGLRRAESRSRIPARIRLSIVVLLMGLLTYNMVAVRKLQALPVVTVSDEKHMRASREAHVSMAQAYPLTWAARKAEDRAAELSVRMAELRAKNQVSVEQRDLERAVWMEEGTRAEAQGLALVDSNPEGALAHFEDAMEWLDRLPRSHPAGVAARKRVEETKKYVAAGRLLIEKYQQAMSIQDHAAAFAHGMRAFREYRGILKPGQLRLRCSINVYPSDSAIDVMGQALLGERTVFFDPLAPPRVRAQRRGYVTYDQPLTFSSRAPEATIVLEAEETSSLPLNVTTSAWQPVAPGNLILRTERGLNFLNLASKQLSGIEIPLGNVPEAHCPGASPGGRIVASLGDGLTAAFSSDGSGPLWRVLLGALKEDVPVLPPLYSEDTCFHILRSQRGDARIVAQRLQDGGLLWSERVPRAPIDGIVAGAHIYLRYPGGQVIPYDVSSGAARTPLTGLYGGSWVTDDSGGLYAFRNGFGLVRIPGSDRPLEPVLEIAGRCDAGPALVGRHVAIAIRDLGLVLMTPSAERIVIPYEGEATALITDGVRYVGIAMAGRPLFVVDIIRKEPWGLVPAGPRSHLLPIFGSDSILVPGALGTVKVYGLSR